MSGSSQDSAAYRKALDEAIRAQGLVPPNKKLDRLKSVYDEHIYVVGQLAWKLKELGVGDGLLSRLLNARFNLDEVRASKDERQLLKEQSVDKTIYDIQQSISALEALAPGSPTEATLKKDKMNFERRFDNDEARKEFVARWREERSGSGEKKR